MFYTAIIKLLKKIGAKVIMEGQKVEVELTDETVAKLKLMFGDDMDLTEAVTGSVSFYIQMAESIKDFKVPEVMPTPIQPKIPTNDLINKAVANAAADPVDINIGESPAHSAKSSDGSVPNTPSPYHDSTGKPVVVNQLDYDPGSVDAEVVSRLEKMRKDSEARQRDLAIRKSRGSSGGKHMVNSNP